MWTHVVHTMGLLASALHNRVMLDPGLRVAGHRRGPSEGGKAMSEKIDSEMVSRRKALSLLAPAALGLAVLPIILTVSDAEAQTYGMQRRAARRTGRQMHRQYRRHGHY